MVEIKVQCDCGQRYKFDVEPVNGCMPFTVACPVCNADGTGKANESLMRLAPPPPVRAFALASAPAHSEAMTASVAPAPPPTARLVARINPAEPEPPPAPVAAFAHPLARSGVLPSRATLAPEPIPEAKKPSFGLGLLGALIGTLLGTVIYFLLFKYTGLKFKLLAVGVGYLSGIGAELMGRKEGSKELGMIAAALALSGILGAQYLIAKSWWKEALESYSGPSYEEAVLEAKKVVTAIPNGTDQEIRLYIAREEADPGDAPDPASVSPEIIKEFRDTTLPEIRDLASGKMTKQNYEKKQDLAKGPDDPKAEDEEGDFKTIFLLLVLSKVNLVSLAAAGGLAFKVCANA